MDKTFLYHYFCCHPEKTVLRICVSLSPHSTLLSNWHHPGRSSLTPLLLHEFIQTANNSMYLHAHYNQDNLSVKAFTLITWVYVRFLICDGDDQVWWADGWWLWDGKWRVIVVVWSVVIPLLYEEALFKIMYRITTWAEVRLSSIHATVIYKIGK